MKKATSFSLVLGMIFLPCMSVSAQKGLRRASQTKVQETETVPEVAAQWNEFETASATASTKSVLLTWKMRSEKGNMGFYIHRVEGNGNAVVNRELVFGSAVRAGGQFPLYGEQYAFLDSFGGPGSAYFIESVDLDGNRKLSQTIIARHSKGFSGDAPGVPSNSPGQDSNTPTIELQQPKLSKELAVEIARSEAAPDPEKHKWIMGRAGVRIDVRKEGIYRVPFSQLEAAGLDLNSDKSLWQLYKNGVEQAIAVNEAESHIEFYGKGFETPESDTQGYFLIVGDTVGKRIENMVARPSGTAITLPSYNQTFTYKERSAYRDTILNGQAENFFGRGIDSNGLDVTFDLAEIDFNVPTATLEFRAQGFSLGAHNISLTLNGQLLSPVTGVAQFSFSGTQTIPTSVLKDASLGQGPNVLRLTSVGPAVDFSFFDSLNLTYARKHSAIEDTLKAYTAANKKTHLSGFTSADVRIFDITFENDPRLITNVSFQDEGGKFGADLSSLRSRVIYAAHESKILAPVAVVANDGEVLGVNTLGADLVIIAYKDFMEKAQTWADYRAAQGYSVKVVNVDEVFNEFGFGNSSSHSIEAFLQYAYANWQVPPQYVLLIGDSTSDPRNYLGTNTLNYVPTRMVSTIFTDTASDEALADFDDDGLAELAIGRIPARDTTQIDVVFQKVTNWEANLGSDPLSRGTVFAADAFDANNNLNFSVITDRVMAELPEGVTKTKIVRGEPNYHTNLISALNNEVCDLTCVSKGRYIVNYTGHGAFGTWGGSDYFWSGHVPSLTNDNNESIYTMLTCLNGYFIIPGVITSLAENLLNHTNGGAVATWSSTGLTTPDVQETMAKRFYKKIGEGSIPRLGDLVKDAKSVINGEPDVRLSFVLLGDPLLKVR